MLEPGRILIYNYETTEVRVSEAKDYVAVATSSGVDMNLLDMETGDLLWKYITPGQEQFACDGDDNLNYVIGAGQAWGPPYSWFILKNLGTFYEVLAEGTMVGPINDLDSNDDASLIAFGSDGGEFILLERTDDLVETVFSGSGLPLIDAIEIGSYTLLIGGMNFIHLYALIIPATIDIDPDTLNEESKGKWVTAYIEFPAGYDVAEIDRATILLNDTIPVDQKWIDIPIESVVGDYDEDDVLDLMVKFDRADVIDFILASSDVDWQSEKGYEYAYVTLELTGQLYDGTPFRGSDIIKVIVPN
jgi:hypothetical protein